MARYTEKILPVTPTILLLLLSFLIAYAPWTLGDRELNWSEGFICAQADGIRYMPLPLVEVHGEALPNAYPLFPMLADGLRQLGCTPELSLRLLNLGGLLAMAILIYTVTLHTHGRAAAAAAAAVLTGALLVIDKSVNGFNNWLFILVIFAGHLLWYYYAAIRGDWPRAWWWGLVFCALGFYLDGAAAFVYFMVPLIFMRRPLGIFKRLRNAGFALGLGVLALTVLLWYLPHRFENVQLAGTYYREAVLDLPEYLWHLLCFPGDFFWRLLPWFLLVWAPFCVAFQTLDKTPLYSRFLRTLFIVDFFILWLTPMDEVCDWLILIPPLAILIGINYELTVRRYGNFFLKLTNIFSWFMLLTGIGLLVYFLLPVEFLATLYEFKRPLADLEDMGLKIFGLTAAGVLILMSIILLRLKCKPPVWAYFLLISYAPLLVFHAIARPEQDCDRARADRGQRLIQALESDGAKPSETVIYKYKFDDLFAEGVYAKSKIRKIYSFEELPKSEAKVVYLLAPHFPNHPSRDWRNLSAARPEQDKRNISLFKGVWLEDDQTAAPKRESVIQLDLSQTPEIKL